MKLIDICVVAAFGVGLVAVDAEARTKKKKAEEKAEDQQSEDAEAADTSENNRASKKFGAVALYTPLSDFALDYGVGGHYILSRELQVGLHVLLGSEDLLSEFPEDSKTKVTVAEISGLAVYGYGRYFFGNSFNALVGIGIRQATGDFEVRTKGAAPGYLRNDFSINSIVVPITLSNHWSWASGFTLGVDWLMVFVPLSGSSESNTTTDLAVSDADRQSLADANDDIAELAKKLSKQSSLTLALTSIGFQF